MLIEVVIFIAGLIAGIVVMWFKNKPEAAYSAKMREELAQQLLELKSEAEKRRNEFTNLIAKFSSIQTENNFLKEKLDRQKKEYEEISARFGNEFKVLANQILEEKSKKFTETNQINIERILNPLGKNIDEFKRKVEETYDKESKQRFSLEEKIKSLVELNVKISEDANNLTRALKGDSKKQGDWGEMILENILESSGLTKGREYETQKYLTDKDGAPVKNESGERLRPDVIVNYPDGKKIIVDSKVSLTSYERYCASEDPAEQELHLTAHIKSVRSHIDELSKKDYNEYVASPEFVMMFIPIEPAYFIAMRKDAELWNYAYSKRVLLISPTNLIAALKLIQDLWRRDSQNKNAMEIAERGGQLYDKFVTLAETLKSLGESIEKTKKSFDTAMGQIKEGRGNLINQVEKLKELGAKAKKSLPEGDES